MNPCTRPAAVAVEEPPSITITTRSVSPLLAHDEDHEDDEDDVRMISMIMMKIITMLMMLMMMMMMMRMTLELTRLQASLGVGRLISSICSHSLTQPGGRLLNRDLYFNLHKPDLGLVTTVLFSLRGRLVPHTVGRVQQEHLHDDDNYHDNAAAAAAAADDDDDDEEDNDEDENGDEDDDVDYNDNDDDD